MNTYHPICFTKKEVNFKNGLDFLYNQSGINNFCCYTNFTFDCVFLCFKIDSYYSLMMMTCCKSLWVQSRSDMGRKGFWWIGEAGEWIFGMGYFVRVWRLGFICYWMIGI